MKKINLINSLSSMGQKGMIAATFEVASRTPSHRFFEIRTRFDPEHVSTTIR